MNGIEVDAAIFKHMMARMTMDPDLKKALAVSRRIEQQQQKAVSGIIPGNETTLENTLGYEQVADLTAWCARHEPDSYLRQAYEFALLEDFDHLYRYANMLDMQSGTMKAENIVGELTEIMPGRPTIAEHRHPMDSICKPMDIKKTAEDQVQLTADGVDFVPVDSLPRDHRYHAYQAEVNAGMVPSQEVVKKHISKHGKDYRFETAPHPLSRFQDRKAVPEY